MPKIFMKNFNSDDVVAVVSGSGNVAIVHSPSSYVSIVHQNVDSDNWVVEIRGNDEVDGDGDHNRVEDLDRVASRDSGVGDGHDGSGSPIVDDVGATADTSTVSANTVSPIVGDSSDSAMRKTTRSSAPGVRVDVSVNAPRKIQSAKQSDGEKNEISVGTRDSNGNLCYRMKLIISLLLLILILVIVRWDVWMMHVRPFPYFCMLGLLIAAWAALVTRFEMS